MPPAEGDRLERDELVQAVRILQQLLRKCKVEFGIIGGAGCSLLQIRYEQIYRGTADIDLVIQPKPTERLYADTLVERLLKDFPQHVIALDQYTPAIRFKTSQGEKHVPIEIFDVVAWPQRPQYDLENPDNDRLTLSLEGTDAVILSPRWLLREKILSQHQRAGSQKEGSDLEDIGRLLEVIPPNIVLTFEKKSISML